MFTKEELDLLHHAVEVKIEDIEDSAVCFTQQEYDEALALWTPLRTKLIELSADEQ